jgi:hypothetical protein
MRLLIQISLYIVKIRSVVYILYFEITVAKMVC